MKNFEKSTIISQAVFKKNTERFLSLDKQSVINEKLKQKLFRFVNEIKSENNRPESMQLFDNMFNEMHGQRIKDLYKYRKDGNHVVALLCNSIPPELIYAMDNFVPVSLCMGAGEVEEYSEDNKQELCPLTRSILGFLNTGMCVFFNVSDYVLGSDICKCISKTAALTQELTDDFEVFTLETSNKNNRISCNTGNLLSWINDVTHGKGINPERFIEYARLFSELRENYNKISELRKFSNPPINGKNSLWTQQLFLVEEPYKLLSAIKQLKNEMVNNIDNNIGYNPDGSKKRIMLITPRIMPPFAEIYRLIENTNAIIVHEETCMGITNHNYNINEFLNILNNDYKNVPNAINYIIENINQTVCSCINGFDNDSITRSIEEYNIDAVINYSFKNCPSMIDKTNRIKKQLEKTGTPVMNLMTDYMDIYKKEQIIMNDINNFLINV